MKNTQADLSYILSLLHSFAYIQFQSTNHQTLLFSDEYNLLHVSLFTPNGLNFFWLCPKFDTLTWRSWGQCSLWERAVGGCLQTWWGKQRSLLPSRSYSVSALPRSLSDPPGQAGLSADAKQTHFQSQEANMDENMKVVEAHFLLLQRNTEISQLFCQESLKKWKRYSLSTFYSQISKHNKSRLKLDFKILALASCLLCDFLIPFNVLYIE